MSNKPNTNRLSIHVDPDNQSADMRHESLVISSPSGHVGIINFPQPPDTTYLPDVALHIMGSGGGGTALGPNRQATLKVENVFDTPWSAGTYEDRARVELKTAGSEQKKFSIIKDRGESVSHRGDFLLAEPHVDNLDVPISLPSDTTSDGFFRSFFRYQSEYGVTTIGMSKIDSNIAHDHSHGYAESISNTVLAVSSSGVSHSGTVALREQPATPATSNNFGKIYVKPYDKPNQTQSLYFLDDGGNEHNITASDSDSIGGHIFGDQYGAAYGGWYTPRSRTSSSSVKRNTLYGYGIDLIMGGTVSEIDNTIIGFQAGSGCTAPRGNTIIGSNSFQKLAGSDDNIVIGYNNLKTTDPLGDADFDIHDSIIIGNKLFTDEVPSDYTLAIGPDGDPFLLGKMRGAGSHLTLISDQSNPAKFKIKQSNFDYNVGIVEENNRNIVTFGSQDLATTAVAGNQAKSMLSMRFGVRNNSNYQQTLMDFDPSGTINVTPSFANPTFKRPTVSISGDLRLLGDFRFADGTTLNTSPLEVRPFSVSGLKRTILNGIHYYGLDYDGVPLAENQVAEVNPDESFVAVDLSNSNALGKMSLTAMGAYITSGTATFADKCNAVFTNPDNFSSINTAKNESSVFIGCDVASSATGWKHGIFIGTEAGKDSTTSNPSLGVDTACIYMGLQAGHTASNTDNAIFIGNGAGKNADNSIKSIFIGPGAGQNSTNANSIGIGAHALEGEISENEGGSRNIEIVAGLDDNDRILYTRGDLSNRLNIQNTIAGDTSAAKISVGVAHHTPTGILEVRKSTTSTYNHSGHEHGVDLQSFVVADTTINPSTINIARVNNSGHFVNRVVSVNHDSEPNDTCDAWFGNNEGFMEDYIYAPTSYSNPTSGWMVTRTYEKGFGTDRRILVVNRDTRMDIHGPGAVGGTAFVVTNLVNGEHRPIYVSCSGDGS